jgi:proline dehydrogenase
MKSNIPNYTFVKKALKRFMPGESVDDALAEALHLKENNIGTVFTHLGENITKLSEAKSVTDHYLEELDKIKKWTTPTEISLKLTQLGFDLSIEATKKNFESIISKSNDVNNFVWIDMEQSSYVDKTLEFYKSFKHKYKNVGVCLQAYLFRTKKDVEDLFQLSSHIRLVKGAYKERTNIAHKEKRKVDENYYELSKILLETVKNKNSRAAFGTHDLNLISKIESFGKEIGLKREQIEFQMLYGIKTAEQSRLAEDGYKLKVLISYGSAWYPWYVRRLAERPANVMFILKNLFTK